MHQFQSQKRMEVIEGDLAAERKTSIDLKRQATRETTELKGTVTKLTLRINILETDLTVFDATKKEILSARKENSDLKRSVEREKGKVARCNAELKSCQSQLSQLEAVAAIVYQSRSVAPPARGIVEVCASGDGLRNESGNKSQEFKQNQAGYLSTSRDSMNREENDEEEQCAIVSDLRLQLEQKDVELSRLRADFREELTENACNKEDGVGRVIDSNVFRGAAHIEASLISLEDERDRLLGVIADLERRLADLKVDKVSVDAQLAQRTLQIAEAQREAEQRATREAGLEREARKRASLHAATERRFEEKVPRDFCI